MELIEKLYLDMLTTDSVCILRKNYVVLNGLETQVGGDTRNSFMNTKTEREYLKEILPEAYYNAVISVWGDIPTIEEPFME